MILRTKLDVAPLSNGIITDFAPTLVRRIIGGIWEALLSQNEKKAVFLGGTRKSLYLCKE